MIDVTELHTPVCDILKRKTPYGYRTVIQMPRAVMVVAFDNQENVHFLSEYMAPQWAYINTFAKGAIEPSESPENAARRELAEELGLGANTLEPLLKLKNQPSYSTAETFVFVARGCTPLAQPTLGDEPTGSIRHKSMPWHALFVERNNIFSCARSLAAIGELIAQNVHKMST